MRHVEYLKELFLFAVVAGNDERPFQARFTHARNHVGAIGVELGGIDVRVGIKQTHLLVP